MKQFNVYGVEKLSGASNCFGFRWAIKMQHIITLQLNCHVHLLFILTPCFFLLNLLLLRFSQWLRSFEVVAHYRSFSWRASARIGLTILKTKVWYIWYMFPPLWWFRSSEWWKHLSNHLRTLILIFLLIAAYLCTWTCSNSSTTSWDAHNITSCFSTSTWYFVVEHHF